MSLKENLKVKRKLDSLLQKLLSTIKEPPGRWWLDKTLALELLDMTDFEHKQVRNLNLYVRPFEGEIIEVVVFDNQLAIYHSTADDIGLRRSPYWQEVFSIKNIRKIMNDKDVIVSKGKESLKRLHAHALALLDLTYKQDDLVLLLEDARTSLEQKSIAQIQESLYLFVDLLDFQTMCFDRLEQDLQIFAERKLNGGDVPAFDPIILFDEKTLFLGMKKWTFPPQSDTDLNWFMKYNMKKEMVDLKGIDVFKFLAELALKNMQVQRSQWE